MSWWIVLTVALFVTAWISYVGSAFSACDTWDTVAAISCITCGVSNFIHTYLMYNMSGRFEIDARDRTSADDEPDPASYKWPFWCMSHTIILGGRRNLAIVAGILILLLGVTAAIPGFGEGDPNCSFKYAGPIIVKTLSFFVFWVGIRALVGLAQVTQLTINHLETDYDILAPDPNKDLGKIQNLIEDSITQRSERLDSEKIPEESLSVQRKLSNNILSFLTSGRVTQRPDDPEYTNPVNEPCRGHPILTHKKYQNYRRDRLQTLENNERIIAKATRQSELQELISMELESGRFVYHDVPTEQPLNEMTQPAGNTNPFAKYGTKWYRGSQEPVGAAPLHKYPTDL